MDKEKEYLSEEKLKSLQEELQYLIGTRRREVLSSLEYAKSLGDLSENAEYHGAREAQGRLEERIAKIEHILKNSVVIGKHVDSGIVDVGSTVSVVRSDTGSETTYEIVGAEESDTLNGKISNRSPLGEAILGKKPGATVSVETPRGVVEYKIKSVS